MLLLSKIFLIFTDQFGYVIEVFHVILTVPLWAIAGPANEILNGQVFSFFDCPPVEQAVDFKGFKIISVTVNKHGGGVDGGGVAESGL